MSSKDYLLTTIYYKNFRRKYSLFRLCNIISECTKKPVWKRLLNRKKTTIHRLQSCRGIVVPYVKQIFSFRPSQDGWVKFDHFFEIRKYLYCTRTNDDIFFLKICAQNDKLVLIHISVINCICAVWKYFIVKWVVFVLCFLCSWIYSLCRYQSWSLA